jgi:hypothetical protein
MKRAINFIAWLAVFFTIVAVILTLSCTYHFINIYYFQDYFLAQCCIVFTMLVWSIKVLGWKETSKNKLYSVFCLLIAVGTAFFMYNKIS